MSEFWEVLLEQGKSCRIQCIDDGWYVEYEMIEEEMMKEMQDFFYC